MPQSAVLQDFSEVPDTAGRKTRKRRRTQPVTKRFAIHANAIKSKTTIVLVR